MKVLWLTEFFPKSDRAEITGGVEARCYFISKHLRRMGCDLTVIARSSTGEIWHPAKISTIPERLTFSLKTIVRGMHEDFDLVEASNSATYPLAWAIGTLRRKPIVYWYPDVFAGFWVKTFGVVGLLGEFADRLEFRLGISKFIAISKSTRNKLISQGVDKSKIDVVYCGIEESEIRQIRRNDFKKYDISAVSRLVSYKRLDDLIRATFLLKKRLREIKVAIVGQGPELAQLRKLTRSLRLDEQISFLGHIKSHKEVLTVVASSKVFCHPSAVEGFGIVVIESAALGVPYVASDIDVISEITQNGQGGLLFKSGDVSDLAGKLYDLLTDKSLAEKKAKEGPNLAKEYTWRKMAQQTVKTYESVYNN